MDCDPYQHNTITLVSIPCCYINVKSPELGNCIWLCFQEIQVKLFKDKLTLKWFGEKCASTYVYMSLCVYERRRGREGVKQSGWVQSPRGFH